VHELSIAVELVDRACDQLSRLGFVHVDAVRVRMGPLCGVVKDALLFSFDVAAADTPLEGARLEIEEIPMTGWCSLCAAEVVLDDAPRWRCPACGTRPSVIRGRDLELVALEVTDVNPDC
jgi:hydrogenase nickel incorporation protein HypA/HybF